MNNNYLEIAIEIISHYLQFDDVEKIFRDINKGKEYLNLYDGNINEFTYKKDDIINYIIDVRKNNYKDSLEDNNQAAFVTITNDIPLYQSNIEQIYNNLASEIFNLIKKGVYQIVKHNNVMPNDRNNVALLQQYFN